jgi:hypothetical protein
MSKGARTASILAGLCAAAAVGFAIGKREPRGPALQPNEQLADGSVVLVAVRSLARLESVAYHMERVVDLKQGEDHLFGLVHAEDSILLIAAGDVTAGIDMAKMRDGDVVVDPVLRSVHLRLPPPEILSVRIDNARTYVHSRKTDLLAKRNEKMEARARQIAEESIRESALQSGILERARNSAEQTLTLLVHSLAYDRVTIDFAD